MKYKYDSMHPIVSDVAFKGDAALLPMGHSSVISDADELNRLREAEHPCRTSAVIAEARHRAEMYRQIAKLAEEESEAMRRERDEWEDAYWRQFAILGGFIRDMYKRYGHASKRHEHVSKIAEEKQ